MVFSVAVWYQSSGSNCLWAPYLESPCSPILCLEDVESPGSCMFNIALSLCSEWTLQNPLEWFSCKCQVAGSHLLAGVLSLILHRLLSRFPRSQLFQNMCWAFVQNTTCFHRWACRLLSGKSFSLWFDCGTPVCPCVFNCCSERKKSSPFTRPHCVLKYL